MPTGPGPHAPRDAASPESPEAPAPQGGDEPVPSVPPAGQLAGAPQLVAEIKAYIGRHQGKLAGRVRPDDPASGGEALGRLNAKAADGLLKSLFAAATTQVFGAQKKRPALALAAVGSYGRGAVAARSDLDVRLLASSQKPELTALAEAMLYPLWDGGLSIGHQIVTIDEVIELSRTDLPTATSLLDWRHLAGDERLSQALLDRARRALFDGPGVASFVERLADEVKSRHERFGGSVYLLEPDVKNGAGGLRDLDVALWVARARWRVESLDDLVPAGILVEREASQIAHARELLWRIRNRLHIAAGRRADRLTFDQQERLAQELGYLEPPAEGEAGGDPDEACGAAVEAFMSDYYRNARAIAHVRELLANRARPQPGRRKEQDIGGGLRVVDGHITFHEQASLAADPAIALRLVQAGVERRAPLDSFAREAVARAAQDGAFAAALRASHEASRLFVALCSTALETPFFGRSVLAEMHELGLLVAMIPEFSPVVGRVHHDVYHVYTVDAHSVAAVDRLRALVRGDLTDEHPLACRLAAEISQPEVLFLATLLHDVGKAIGGKDHATRGADMSVAVGQRLGLAPAQIDQIAHLVRTHLVMYHVATRRDVDDPATVDEFAKSLRGRENLRELYLLTVADLSTTSPTAMTAWKAKLLDELYLAADGRLAGQAGHGADRERLELAHREALSRAGGSAFARSFLGSMPERYLLSNDPASIAAHIAVAERAGSAGSALALRPSAHAGLCELCVVAADRPGLLAGIAAAIVAAKLEVQAAQILSHPLPDGTTQAVDLFWVKGAGADPRAATRTAAALERDLPAFVSGERPVTTVLGARGSSPWASRHSPPVQTAISVDDRASATHGILEVVTRDRPGVLCSLALALHELGLSISLAKINTEGTCVADVFYVTDEAGQKIELLPRADEIRQKIVAALGQLTPREGTPQR